MEVETKGETRVYFSKVAHCPPVTSSRRDFMKYLNFRKDYIHSRTHQPSNYHCQWFKTGVKAISHVPTCNRLV